MIDLKNKKFVAKTYLKRQAKALETKILKTYKKSPDWLVILKRFNTAIFTTYNEGVLIDVKKLQEIKNEILAEVANV